MNCWGLMLLNYLHSHPSFTVFVHWISDGLWHLFIFMSLLRPLMVRSEQLYAPSFTNESSYFSFRSPQNVNRGPHKQFTSAAAPTSVTPFFSFLCFLHASLGRWCIPGRGSTGAHLLAGILEDGCVCVEVSVGHCVSLGFLSPCVH